VDENHIVYTIPSRKLSRCIHVCRPPCGVCLGLGDVLLSQQPCLALDHYTCHYTPTSWTETVFVPSLSLSLSCSLARRSTFLRLASSLRFPRSCRCSIHERNECRETIHCSYRSSAASATPGPASLTRPSPPLTSLTVLYRQYI